MGKIEIEIERLTNTDALESIEGERDRKTDGRGREKIHRQMEDV